MTLNQMGLVIVALFAITADSFDSSVYDPPEEPLSTILMTIADSSRLAKVLRFDPRILSADDSGFTPGALIPMTDDQLRHRESVALERGFRTGGDAFLAIECQSGGRWMITQGPDTLMHPSRSPATQELKWKCQSYRDRDPDTPRVLIQVAPKRVADGWLILVHIVGDDGGEDWEFLFSDNYDLRSARLTFAFQH